MTETEMLRGATLAEAKAALDAGRATSEGLLEAAFAAIEDETGEGLRTVLTVYREAALVAARAADAMRQAGGGEGPLAGLPLTIKDLFDVKGEPTRAGSVVLADAEPAVCDAPAVARLKAAGAVVVGKTNMTEFAYSGLGINPHYGTPKNPWDRETGRIPGGSSSGAAVSVADGMCLAAIGSDTAGSVRIPASLCGVVGFKPTSGRHPMKGLVPLSTTLDTIGPLARSVACCRLLDGIMAGTEHATLPRPVRGLKFAVPQTIVFNDLDEPVAKRFAAALSRLSEAGASIEEKPAKWIQDMRELSSRGGFSAPESWTWHRRLIATSRELYDPRVLFRILPGETMTASDYIEMHAIRRRMRQAADKAGIGYDAFLLPTTALIAPPIADLEADDSHYFAANGLMLRNTMLANMLDRPAVTLPVGEAGGAPVGLMVMGETGRDADLLDIAEALEGVLKAR